jgi:DNA-directed RNA polymerase specialized sigma24 family protein
VGNVPASTEEAFEAFVDAHAGALGRLAYQLTGEHDSALDLVQDVLVRLVDKWTKVAVADYPLAYARRMMVNLHLNSHRRRSLVPRVPRSRTWRWWRLTGRRSTPSEMRCGGR